MCSLQVFLEQQETSKPVPTRTRLLTVLLPVDHAFRHMSLWVSLLVRPAQEPLAACESLLGNRSSMCKGPEAGQEGEKDRGREGKLRTREREIELLRAGRRCLTQNFISEGS